LNLQVIIEFKIEIEFNMRAYKVDFMEGMVHIISNLIELFKHWGKLNVKIGGAEWKLIAKKKEQ
jgi:hypothetical protein